eukprot:CAMPEP_0197715752 /NCGR_PEP_ID=MMETSP1434-20131217/864_1 /TAXON_ID=265543 /ORGANISM="Minutocellus polymorphus, Strain CCMP3303" /LENGTH=153 /DNA_ID=CAMNT_0043299969 /DNA_START=36 /DNA_END=493 /DNA_ORIENTATION=+
MALQYRFELMKLATTPPMPPSPMLASTKKLNAMRPKPTAVSVAASTSNSSTKTSCSPGRGVASSPLDWERDISVEEYPSAASLSSWDDWLDSPLPSPSPLPSDDAMCSVLMHLILLLLFWLLLFFLLLSISLLLTECVRAQHVPSGEMEKAPT